MSPDRKRSGATAQDPLRSAEDGGGLAGGGATDPGIERFPTHAMARPLRHARAQRAASLTLLAAVASAAEWTESHVRTQVGSDDPQIADLLAGLIVSLDLTRDRRHLVTAYGRLVRKAGEDASALAEAFTSGEFTAAEYVGLGEVTAAERVAATAIDGVEPVRDPRVNPYDGSPVVHISTPRLEAFLHDDHAALGTQVAARIGEHLRGCEACSAVAEAVRLRCAG